jgi:GGDEF domain-containing protein
LIDAVAAPLEVAGHIMTPSISVGIAHAQRSSTDPTSLLRASDIAMYRAKDAGGGRCELSDAGDAA